MSAVCEICPNHCTLAEGKLGICHARRCVDGKVICDNYGKLTAIALDPIEKKPLARFMPHSKILSTGSYGCNLSCPFCQNADISTAGPDEVPTRYVVPDELIQLALEARSRGNIGVAYTYNEPLISFEYVRDVAELGRQQGLKNVLVTNGYVNDAPLQNCFLSSMR